jgi:transposase
MSSRSRAKQPPARKAVGRAAALNDVRRLVEQELSAAIVAASQRGVSLRELAAVLGVSPETVRRVVKEGKSA